MNPFYVLNKAYKGINPVEFGYQTCESNHKWGPGIRTYWLLHFVVSGTGIFQTKDNTYTLQPGQIFVTEPYTQIFYQADKNNPWEYIWLAFTCDEGLPVELPSVLTRPELQPLFESLKLATRLQNGRTEFLCAKVWELFSILLEEKAEKPDYIQQAVNLIHAEYMNDLTVQTLALRLGLDRTYFSALFKKHLGTSPKQYLLHYRMEQAAMLLSRQQTPVGIIAVSVGYNDVYTFSKAFKRHFGCAPTDYNKKRQVD